MQLKLRVRNADQQTLPTVAVTVQTKGRVAADAQVAFGQQERGADLASAARPIWILDDGPKGGDTAYVNTWLAGALKAGETRELTWNLVPSKAGHLHDHLPRGARVDRARDRRRRAGPAAASPSASSTPRSPRASGDDGKVERGSGKPDS